MNASTLPCLPMWSGLHNSFIAQMNEDQRIARAMSDFSWRPRVRRRDSNVCAWSTPLSRLSLLVVCGAMVGPVDAAQPVAAGRALAITAPPDAFFSLVRERDRDLARRFYKKHLDIDGIPVVAAA